METGNDATSTTFPEDSYSPGQIIVAVLITALAVAFGFSQTIKNTIFSVKNPEGIYTLKEVNTHNTPEDCWLVVDGFVFDLTSESKKHPAMFSCGTDGSANYHKNHGPTIRDRMMV
ncbi:MAG: cytochrome b5 domain-containing protein, partial [Patescibacteria group bacterium]